MTNEELIDKEIEWNLSREKSMALFKLGRRALEKMRSGEIPIPQYVDVIVELFESVPPLKQDMILEKLLGEIKC